MVGGPDLTTVEEARAARNAAWLSEIAPYLDSAKALRESTALSEESIRRGDTRAAGEHIKDAARALQRIAREVRRLAKSKKWG